MSTISSASLDQALLLLLDIDRDGALIAAEQFDLDARVHRFLDQHRGLVQYLEQARGA